MRWTAAGKGQKRRKYRKNHLSWKCDCNIRFTKIITIINIMNEYKTSSLKAPHTQIRIRLRNINKTTHIHSVNRLSSKLLRIYLPFILSLWKHYDIYRLSFHLKDKWSFGVVFEVSNPKSKSFEQWIYFIFVSWAYMYEWVCVCTSVFKLEYFMLKFHTCAVFGLWKQMKTPFFWEAKEYYHFHP